MIPEREQRDGNRTGAPGGPYAGQPPLLERKRAFAVIAPLAVMAAILYGVHGLGTGAGNDLVAAGCFLGAFIVAAAWLKHLAIPFVTKGRLASGLTVQDAIARRRERRERREQRER
jgi:hypothetical protein